LGAAIRQTNFANSLGRPRITSAGLLCADLGQACAVVGKHVGKGLFDVGSRDLGDPLNLGRCFDRLLVVARQNDRMIPPDAQRAMAKRAGSTVVELEGSHAIYVSQPGGVTELIETAAETVKASAN
jgi:pimeloyl-ACP methyl ester carboxylesterase